MCFSGMLALLVLLALGGMLVLMCMCYVRGLLTLTMFWIVELLCVYFMRCEFIVFICSGSAVVCIYCITLTCVEEI